ncbi:hypothetical protein YWIDRAFT_06256 [Streptomyces sp. SceaMP-e96]|nr:MULTISPECIES: hypothetical protein [unclassified Streptomyces]SCK34584.1 hypothetical protein YWIDRAFT_06256 [Streptomyces sp. SceaMP-e96]
MDPADFPAAREQGGSIDTIMTQQTVPLDEAREVLNRSEQRREGGQQVHAICPMVIPRGRSFLSMLPVLLLLVLGVVGSAVVAAAGSSAFTHPLFGIHYWVLSVAAVAFVWWRQGMVMVPDGCQALITRFGKLEQVVGPGRVILVADHLPRLVRIGGGSGTDSAAGVDFLALARELVGERGTELFSDEDMAAVRARLAEVADRISGREEEIAALLEAERPTVPAAGGPAEPEQAPATPEHGNEAEGDAQ